MDYKEIVKLATDGKKDSFKKEMDNSTTTERQGTLIYMLNNLDIDNDNIKACLLMYMDELKKIRANASR